MEIQAHNWITFSHTYTDQAGQPIPLPAGTTAVLLLRSKAGLQTPLDADVNIATSTVSKLVEGLDPGRYRWQFKAVKPSSELLYSPEGAAFEVRVLANLDD